MRHVARAGFILLFWIVAALLVVGTHSALVKVIAIVLVSYGYMRICASEATVDHALLVGMTWLLLDIGAELARSSPALIGPPARPAIHDVLLLAWIVAPALFARSASRASA